jgi:hypothetical protein
MYDMILEIRGLASSPKHAVDAFGPWREGD